MATENQTLASNPHWKAALGTAAVFLLMAGAAGVAYWYGSQTKTTSATPSTNQNQNTNRVAGAEAPKRVAYAGSVATINDQALEVVDSTTKQTLNVSLTKDTSIRKLDFRTIPKEGVGDGVAIQTSELKAGQQVVVIAEEASTSPIVAQKVSLIIYP